MAVDLRGLDRLIKHLDKIQAPNPHPLLISTQRIMFEDNRRGILAGEDAHGGYMPAVRYRPVGKPKRLAKRQKNNAGRGPGVFGGTGPMAAGLHNNLTSAEYRRLAGPPLAPRGKYSRVITNYKTMPEIRGMVWTVYGMWDQVVDVKGRPFLKYHFKGSGRLPMRDLVGVRPRGMAEARRTFVNWARDQIRYNKAVI